LALLSTLGVALISLRGFAADEVGEVYARAGVLCEHIPREPQVAPAIWGLWVFHLVRCNLPESLTLARNLLAIGEASGDDRILIEGLWTTGDSLFWLGDLDGARWHLEQARTLYDPARHHANAFTYGQDPGVGALCYLGFTYWHQGRPSAAATSLASA